MKKDFLSVWELETHEFYKLFWITDRLREMVGRQRSSHFLRGRTVALIFEKSSTRTRVSFEVGISDLGGEPLFLSSNDIHLGKSESIEDTGKVLSRYVDALVIRTYAHERVKRLAQAAEIPVINALSDLLHPCQAMADYYTLWHRGILDENLKLVYVGDGNNVCHSLILGAAKLQVKMVIASPKGYAPHPQIVEKAKSAGGDIRINPDPREAVKGADVIYTDVWTSMGQEEEKEKRKKAFGPYQINSSLLSLAKPDTLIMHCLPAHRGEEITDEVIDGKSSIVFEQAENRLHIQRAILLELIANGETG